MNGLTNTVQKLFKGFLPLLKESTDHEKIRAVCRRQAVYLPDRPVNVAAIANQFGLRVYLADLEKGVSGALDLTENRIYIERSDSVNRKRFTCAHEVGHFLLHANLQKVFLFRGSCVNGIEKEATDMAAEILMPTHFVEEFRSKNMSSPDMAKKFEVSDLDAEQKLELLNSSN